MAERCGTSVELYNKALQLCQRWDTDNDGAISQAELAEALAAVYPGSTKEERDNLMKAVDLNGDGLIQYQEFLNWLAMPVKDRLAFADQFKLFVECELNVCSGAGKSAPASPLISSPSTREVEQRLVSGFTHPLLASFKAIANDEPLLPHSAIVCEQTRYPARGGGMGFKEQSDGTLVFEARPAQARPADSSSEAELLAKVEGLARAYLPAFEAFADLSRASSLRLVPLPVAVRNGPALTYSPDVFASALAIALIRLRSETREKLTRVSVEVVAGAEVAALNDSLFARVALAAQPPTSDERGGSLVPRGIGGDLSWIRRDNDADARLSRLSAFFLTQRANWTGGYAMSGTARTIKLECVSDMVKGTRVVIGDELATRVSRKPELIDSSGLDDAFFSCTPDRTVMGVAQAYANQSLKVVAVSAASAYHVGGGVSTGGRHALEEAWCISSSLYTSLQSLKFGATEGSQHIPVDGCVASPCVEIFRGPTTSGYGFLPKPRKLCGVISVAMFNRNAEIADSPLDSPALPVAYVEGTRAKLRAVVSASKVLGADVLVVPDVGCGVFKNEPRLVGACLGSILATAGGHLQRVVLASANTDFVDACFRAFAGEDPRQSCFAAVSCSQTGDPSHKARFRHPGDAALNPDTASLNLAYYLDESRRPPCSYGKHCHIKRADHLTKFSHPPPEVMPAISGAVLNRESSRPLQLPPPSPTILSFSSTGSAGERPLCKYGDQCYSKNPTHFEQFRHTGRDVSASLAIPPTTTCVSLVTPSEDSAEEKKRKDELQLVHVSLNQAKDGYWDLVKKQMVGRPDLINIRPEGRQFGLLHFACFQVRREEIDWLIKQGADINLKTKDGKDMVDVLADGMKNSPPATAAQEKYDKALMAYLQSIAAGVTAVPTSTLVESRAGERSAPRRAVIVTAVNRALEGRYEELPDKKNGAPAYKNSSSTRPLYLYMSSRKEIGWSIDETFTNAENPLAYIGESRRGADVCADVLREYWKCWYPSTSFTPPGSYRQDYIMKVRRAESV